jgi:16S rRNA (cytosine967-C5)-methyltransferase
VTAEEPRRARPRTSLDPARRAAHAALVSVETEDAYLNLALPRHLAEHGLGGVDAAFATELAYGTARMQGLYDAVLSTLVAGGLTSLEPPVLVGLRLGAHQQLAMRVPAHAAVGTSVELVREAVGERPVRMVNAVLRKVGRSSLDEWIHEVAPPREDDPIGHLAVATSHPTWIVTAYRDALQASGPLAQGSPDEIRRLRAALEADNTAPRVALAVRPGLGSVDELVAAGGQVGRWSPLAATLASGDPGALEAVRSGRAGVQDEGSQLAALAVVRAPVDGADARWLDVCSGPGGKSALLRGLAPVHGAELVSAERLPHRARLVRSALRAYLPPHPIVVADGTRPPWRAGTFDRVIADVPCSGLGALRRRPEARWRRGAADIARLASLQAALLDGAVDSARVGGAVAYVTCSPHLAETRDIVDAALSRRSDIAELDARELLPGVPDLGPGPHAQLWPHIHGTDAMFVSVLRRTEA